MIEQRLFQPFVHAKYLSEQNYRNYIAIINYLYQQHTVYYAPPSLPTSILEHIKENDDFGLFVEYTLQKLEGDLGQLEDWGNVISHQDSGKVPRLEDFYKRKLRYQCTQTTIDIERMLEKMNSQINRVKGSLDTGLVNSLSNLILTLELYKKKTISSADERKELVQLWDRIFDQFENLRKESSDYLGVIHSKNIEEAMQNKEITAFRLKFTEYLTGFIITLQKNINIIEHSIVETGKSLIYQIITQLIENQKNKPILAEHLTDNEYADIYMNQWNALRKWFVYDEFSERYVDYLLKQTNETISRFTKYLQQLSERDQQIKNRKKDFEHIAKLFRNEENFDLCKKSFGAMTNVEKPLHLFSSMNRKIESEKPLYEHEPEIKSLKDAKAVLARNKRKVASVEPTEEDLLEIQRLQKQKKYEEQKIQELVDKEIVRVKELENVEPFVRKALLHWISQTNGKKSMTGKTDQGIRYIIEKESNEWIHLSCTDGRLEMPDYVFCFEVG